MNIDGAGNGVSGEVHFIGIYPTQEAHPFLLISTSSQGKNTDDAQLHAQNIDFPLEIKDNQLWIPDGYFLQKGKPYRFQRVNIRLFVPKGKKVVSYSMISKRKGLGLPNGTFQAHYGNTMMGIYVPGPVNPWQEKVEVDMEQYDLKEEDPIEVPDEEQPEDEGENDNEEEEVDEDADVAK